ncbi:transglycosylase SLT domain-containing protein [Streptomyces harbinensis]|uniref:transglycosylase SLT domain-containing protein n=1 Tax=Streptomyces harbinensis TaxID=1176198 RepID=UPI0036BCEF27
MCMTATHGVSRIRTRTAAVAGIVTAGAAALSLVHAPGAVAEPHHSAVAPTATSTSAPAAFSLQAESGLLPGASDAADSADSADDGADDTAAADDADTGTGAATAEATDAADTAADVEAATPADKGRGAEYNADGTLVVIDKKDQPKPEPASAEQIDQWINEALDVLRENGIPGSYEGIYKNLMRESSGDPHTINMWDSNAHKNIPSKGLLQVIDPTFEQYHVDGTSTDIYDPVANIAAACNYAADRYGSMDNVNSAY